jgi:hypothetical protein
LGRKTKPLLSSSGWKAVTKLISLVPLDRLIAGGDTSCLANLTNLAVTLRTTRSPSFKTQATTLPSLQVQAVLMPPQIVDGVLAYLADGTPLPNGVDHATARLMSQWGVKHALMD